MKVSAFCAGALALLSLAACDSPSGSGGGGGGGGGGGPVPVSTVAVAAPRTTIEAGETMQASATPRDAAGNALTGRAVSWSSDAAGVAAVNAEGQVEGRTPGTTVIRATSEGKTGDLQVTVVAAAVASLRLSADSLDLVRGGTTQLTATLRDARGAELARAATWSTTDAARATVSPTGVVTAVDTGKVRIIATAETRADTVVVRVVPVPIASLAFVPDSVQLELGKTASVRVVAYDASGAELPGRAVSVVTQNAGIASITNTAQGVQVTGAAVGTAMLQATAEGRAATAKVVVIPVRIATLEITPADAEVQVGGMFVSLFAVAKDENGNVLGGRTVVFTASPAGIVQLTPGPGVVQVSGAQPGTATITATAEGKTATAQVRVVPRPVASVVVTPQESTVPVGTTATLTASPRDAAGQPLAGRAVAWSSSDEGVARVSAEGVVTAVAPGTATITATVEGRSGTAMVRVPPQFAVVVAGEWSSCGLTPAGKAYCWGSNENGNLGRGSSSPTLASTVPVPVSGGLTFDRIAAGGRHWCALTPAGKAYCWGQNQGGAVGDGSNVRGDVPAPVAVAGGLTFTRITAGFSHSCGLTAGGAAYCWGSSYRGQRGDGTRNETWTPLPVSGGLAFADLDASSDHTCGVTTAGALHCWGNNNEAQLGIGGDAGETCDGLDCSTTPRKVATNEVFRSVSTGANHSCAVTTGNAGRCWGNGGGGGLGNGSLGFATTPVAVSGGLSFREIQVNNQTSCGITTAGETWCWGNNGGKFGNGAGSTSTVPVAGAGGLELAQISVGQFHSCGTTAQRVAYCWGSNAYGAIGDGQQGATRFVPVPVSKPAG